MKRRLPSLILASASPRRSELLRQIGISHEVRAVDVDESARPGESPRDLVCRLALDKALEGHRLWGGEAAVLGADTVVVLESEVFGKPRDEADAVRMLGRLGGRMHEVMTAVALAPSRSEAAVGRALSITRVTMRAITLREAAAYWASGEPRDKAGGYAIQGHAAMFIERIEGSFSGVMGLPLYETAQLLHAQGLAGEPL